MRKYIFHTDYRYSIEKKSFLVWIEIIDRDKNIDKLATKEDIKDLFLRKNIPFFETVSADFFIPHQKNIRLLSGIREIYPELELSGEKIKYLKKYIDCAIIPFYDFNYFERKLKTLKNSKLSPSFDYYNKFQLFVRNIVREKYYVPGFYNDSEEYNFIYYPFMTDEIKKDLSIFEKNIPLISVYATNKMEEPSSFVENMLLSGLNAFIDYFSEKGEAGEFVDKTLRASSIAHLVIKKSNVEICDFNFEEWKNWVSKITCRYEICLTFSKMDIGLWRINYGLISDRTFTAQEIYGSDDNYLRSFFVTELVRISQFSQHIKDSLLSPAPEFVDITESELLSFLRNDSEILKDYRVRIYYPGFFKNIHKVIPGIRFVKRWSQKNMPERNVAINKRILNFDWQLTAGNKVIKKELIDKLIATDKEYFMLDDEYIELDNISLRRIVRKLKEQADFYSEGVNFFEALNYDLDDEIEIDKSEIFEDLLQSRKGAGELSMINSVPGFCGVLRNYQKTGVSFLNFLKDIGFGAILADDMGLGKTIQIIALLLLNEEKSTTLIIAPTTLLYNWEMEIKKFGPSIKTYLHYGVNRTKDIEKIYKQKDVIICSYGIVKRDLDILLKFNFDTIIIDEAQYIKNSSSEQAKAVKKLRGNIRFALTGTPIENRLMELWSIMDFVNPGLLLDSGKFFDKYELPIMKNNDQHKKDQLFQVISPFVLRRMKTDRNIIRDLPDKQEIKIYLPLTDEQTALYDNEISRVEKNITGKSRKFSKTNMLAVITRLKQICNHPLNYYKKIGSADNIKKRSSKLDSLAEMIKTIEQEGRKTLVFTQFVQTGKLIRKYLTAETGKDILFFHGSLKLKARREMIEEFENNDDIPAMILSLRAGGLGLNLTAANYVVHFDRWWNPAVENQAVDRVHRIGQTRNTFVYKFITKGTLEERIDELIESKLKLADGIIPKGESLITDMSEKEFINLIKRL